MLCRLEDGKDPFENIDIEPVETETDMEAIVDIQMRRLVGQAAKAGITLECSDAALDEIARLGYDPVYGARPLKRAIQHLLLDPLSLEVLEGKFAEGDVIEGRVEDGELVFDIG